MDLVEKIFFLMELNDIKNLSQLSRIVELPYSTISEILRRKNTDLRLSSLRKFCKAFNISMTVLTDDKIDLKKIFDDKNELSQINFASYSGLDTDGLDETDIKEIKEIIKLKKKLKEKKEN